MSSIDLKLTVLEQGRFDLIVRSAIETGWVHVADSLDAGISGSTVVVRNNQGDKHRTLHYQHTERWLFDFLADLAHGRWKW